MAATAASAESAVPRRPAADLVMDLAWRGEAACLFSIPGRDPTKMYWTPDAGAWDCSIAPCINVVHGYRSPLAFTGMGSEYVPQEVYDDLTNTSDELIFPLKFLKNYPACSISDDFRALFVEGRKLFDR